MTSPLGPDNNSDERVDCGDTDSTVYEVMDFVMIDGDHDEVDDCSAEDSPRFSDNQLQAINWLEQNTMKWVSEPTLSRLIGLIVRKLQTNPSDPLMIDGTKILEEAYYIVKLVALELVDKVTEGDSLVGLGHTQWNVFAGMFEDLFRENEEQWDEQRQVLGRLLNRHIEAWGHYVIQGIELECAKSALRGKFQQSGSVDGMTDEEIDGSPEHLAEEEAAAGGSVDDEFEDLIGEPIRHR